MTEVLDWFRHNQEALWWLAGATVILFAGTLLVLPIVIARMPSDYFTKKHPPGGAYGQRHPAVGLALFIAKNVIGALFVLAGIVMLVIPGPGVLAIFVGLTLLDFPGKRALELRIAGERHVLRAINWMRKRAKRPPLVVPDR
jgi:hypothetical protein